MVAAGHFAVLGQEFRQIHANQLPLADSHLTMNQQRVHLTCMAEHQSVHWIVGAIAKEVFQREDRHIGAFARFQGSQIGESSGTRGCWLRMV